MVAGRPTTHAPFLSLEAMLSVEAMSAFAQLVVPLSGAAYHVGIRL